MLNLNPEKLTGIKTPVYYYDLDLLRATLQAVNVPVQRYGYHVHYAFKANYNDKILSIIRDAGLGADCVSGNEVKKAIESGFDPSKIVFAGVGKTDEEIEYAIAQSIYSFNCESTQELEVINSIAMREGKTVRVAIRINPNVNANTHKYITTGLEENKFGISISQLPDVLEVLEECANLRLEGLHFHIGSQITDMSSFRNLCTRVNEIVQWFNSRNVSLKHINVGGGLGVNYNQPDQESIPDFEAYFSLFNEFLQLERGQELHFELGRAIVAQCGSLLSRVLYIKNGVNTNFIIVDAGMTELIRPALYQSFHLIENLSAQDRAGADQFYDVVGPVCESSDCFGKRILLPVSKRGDLMAIRTAGAYGEVMSSGYNLREKVNSITSEDLG
ncbi:MAG: diaminopimelate decarboxylase [Flavobacteriales bacterium]|nr:diaminopimelate decarboxylase [Flavobacteriales bacterium]